MRYETQNLCWLCWVSLPVPRSAVPRSAVPFAKGVGWVEVRNPTFMLALLGFTPYSLFPDPLFPVPRSAVPFAKVR
ncbi:MAG: hypothetical protein F6K55_40840 [Moorea sp. SIO4A3]|nr:hypothetical protein [Moorena sp. SIO4A3]